ncbi:Uncharacterized protein EbC_pEb17200330 (plasmid) [Erwinia billingiae Eb661]|uniref:Uncharacterized protein n=1 Tax=Erwinia billingiae (strain Eb661) TaxID=634500 RepID=D8MJN8_ERWBE|nr:Uncharacterized protein EbC_pEb17200330 [Erwinia billingiae Eb661]
MRSANPQDVCGININAGLAGPTLPVRHEHSSEHVCKPAKSNQSPVFGLWGC